MKTNDYLDCGLFSSTPLQVYLPPKVVEFINLIFTGKVSGLTTKVRTHADLFRIIWESEVRGHLKGIIPHPDTYPSGEDTKLIELLGGLKTVGLNELMSHYSLELDNSIYSRLNKMINNRSVSDIDKLAALLVLHVLYLKGKLNA